MVPITFIVVGSVGYSLIEGSLTLAWKRVELLHELALGLMVFFSGALVPLDRLPALDGGHRQIHADQPGHHRPPSDVRPRHGGRSSWRRWGLHPAVGISLAYLFAGIIVFAAGEALAKRRGSLARY